MYPLDYPNSTLMTPYIGVGGGAMMVRSPLVGTITSGGSVVEQKELSDWTTGYQLMAGISREMPGLSPDTRSALVLGYRYVASGEGTVSYKTAGGMTDHFEHKAHNIELGWRFYF